MTRDLTNLFRPKSIAVIGASDVPTKVGSIALKNIISSGFRGRLYPVNPTITNIGGVKFYSKVKDIPEIPDLAVMAIPAAAVLGVMEEVGEKGIKNIVIYSAGFREIGGEGERSEKILQEIATKYSLNILGPNCLGFANINPSLNVTFGQVNKIGGNLRLISQSGALAASLLDWCETTGVGFSDFVTLGNKTVINENDILEYWSTNAEASTKITPIGMYLESVNDGKKLAELLKSIGKNNPVFVLKPGKSKAAVAAMKSHTGSIAGEDSIFEAVLKDCGAIRCQELGEFFDLAMGMSWGKQPQGPRVAIISNAGGPAVMASDTVEKLGLEMANLSKETHDKLVEKLPRMASIINPVDLIGDALAKRFGEALEIVIQEQEVDSVIVLLTPQLMTQIALTAEIIGEIGSRYDKPIFCSFIGGQKIDVGQKILCQNKIANFEFPERAISVVARMWEWNKNKIRNEELGIRNEELGIRNEEIVYDKIEIEKALAEKNNQKLLEVMEISTPKSKIIITAEEAVNFAQAIGWPVVMKIINPEILHKADVGGVITNIRSEAELEQSFNKISELDGQIQIQQQVGAGIEVIAGVKRDPNYGLVLLFGAGGKYAEIFGDHNIIPAGGNIQSLIENSKIYRLLNGFRGDPKYDLTELTEIMTKLIQLANDFPQVTEVEINPLILTHQKTWAVDPKVVLEKKVSGPGFKHSRVIDNKILTGKFHHIILSSELPVVVKPGQYISVKVAEGRINSYSVAGVRHGNELELLIDTSPGGVGSHFFENLKPGETVDFLGPFGNFSLKTDDNSDQLIFMATGSGIAPLRLMIRSLLLDQKFEKPITFYFGVRYREDIFWWEEFDELANTYPNFTYRLCLSKPDEAWTGDRGHITELVAKDFENCANISVYLCGGKAMIAEAQEVLSKANCHPDHIYFEKFD